MFILIFVLYSFIFVFNNGNAHIIKKADVGDENSKDNINKTFDDSSVGKNDVWQGKWFPFEPGQPHVNTNKPQRVPELNNTTVVNDTWKGKWFPYKPGSPQSNKDIVVPKQNKKPKHEICDDAKFNINLDFDPIDLRNNYHYICVTSNRSKYNPDLNTTALLHEASIPAAYIPPIKCLNESIKYDEKLPTFGSFRPLEPKYGRYIYLPPQRWLRNLAAGAIVMLYHPCAFSGQVKELMKIVESCLYRHIITPTQALSPERPLALLAWGKSLQMSVVDNKLVNRFIKENAKRGPLAKMDFTHWTQNVYEVGLEAEAHLVTTIQDIEVCGYQEM